MERKFAGAMLKKLLGIALILLLTVGAMAAGAGIYKWVIYEPATILPASSPITPKPTLNRSLIGGLLTEYVSDETSPGRECLVIGGSFRGMSDIDYDLEFNRLRWLTSVDGNGFNWTIRATGGNCKGLEKWEIDDNTGAIEYLGPSK